MEHDQNNISLPQYTTISSQHQHPHAYAYHHQNTRDAHGPSFVQPLIVDETKHYEDLPGELESEDETLHEDPKQNQNTMFHASPTKKPTKKTRGRVKIKMEFIQNKLRRYTTFSKRKTGIMKKAYELSTLTGTQVMLLVASETGHVYTFATRKLQPMITSESGKALIQTCLNSPDPAPTLPTQVQVVSPPSVEHTIPSPPIIEPRHSDDVPVNYTTQEHESKAAATSEIEYTSSQSANQSAAYKPSKQQLSNYTTILSPAITKSHSPSHHNQPQILSGQLQVHRIHPQNIILTGNSPILHTGNVVVNTTSAAHLERVHQSTSSAANVLTLVNQSQPQRSNVQWVYNNEQVIYASPTQKINDNSRPPVIQSQSDGQLLNEATILVRK